MGASWDVGACTTSAAATRIPPTPALPVLLTGGAHMESNAVRRDRFILPGHVLTVTIIQFQGQLPPDLSVSRRAIRHYCRDVKRAIHGCRCATWPTCGPTTASPPFSHLACGQDAPWNEQSTTWAPLPPTRHCAPTHHALGRLRGEPTRSAFVATRYHYMDGAWFPRGEAGRSRAHDRGTDPHNPEVVACGTSTTSSSTTGEQWAFASLIAGPRRLLRGDAPS